MSVNELINEYRLLSDEDRDAFEYYRKKILLEQSKEKIKKQRLELAKALEEIIVDDKPYISTEWIKKNIFKIDDNN